MLDLACVSLNEIHIQHLLTDLCSDTVEALDLSGVAVYMVDERTRVLRPAAASDAATWDLAHIRAHDVTGPALDCVASGNPLIVQATAVLPVRHDGGVLGCLQLFATKEIRADQYQAAEAISAALAMVLVNTRTYQASAQLAKQLSVALQTRLPIEQAKGRLMERHRVDPGEAYRMLRGHARRNRITIGEAAAAVLTGAGVPVSAVKKTPGWAARAH
nr:hypothetical protein [Kibdelosporangium sp. MJ126-NF4]